MRCLKSIDEIYSEVRDYDLVITNDAALETALNSRVDTVRIGTFAITPRHLARDLCYGILGKPEMDDLELVATVSEETGLDFKYVHSEIQNFREIRRHTAEVRAHLTTSRSRRVYDSYSSLPTRERAMSAFDPRENCPRALKNKRIAVVGLDLFDDLDKHFLPEDFDEIDIFTSGEYQISEFHQVGNDRQMAENAVDLIDANNPANYAIVLKASSPIVDSVRVALYRRGLPFVNSLSVRDLTPIRDYISFLSYAMDYGTVRVGQVKELFAGLNGFFRPGFERFLLSKLDESEMEEHVLHLRDVMCRAQTEGMTFSEVMSEVSIGVAKSRVRTVLKSLGLTDEIVTPSKLSVLRYAVDNVAELKHNEEIPENERTGILIADCSNSVFVDKPVVIFLGMDQDWNVSVVGKRYIDAEQESAKNAIRLTAMLQQGHRRVYCINSARNGKSVEPCLTFGQIMKRDGDKENPCKSFSDIAPVVDGTWVRRKEVVPPARGEVIVDGYGRFDRPFSKSSFNAYYSCPRCYMFRSLLQTEESKSSEFGNLIHAFAELYACHREKVLEMGTNAFSDIISDRYTGLSSPTMEEVDRDAVRLAMGNVVRYLDMKGVVAPLDTYNSMKRHPNQFLEELGLSETSTVCETDHLSTLHQIHGKFDLYWNGTVTDYKTGRGKDSSEIAKAMDPESGIEHPEFQPLIYLALASEMPSSSGNFEMFYAMDNDVESSEEGFDIRRNIRTVRLVPGDLREAMRNSVALENAMREGLRKELKNHAAALIAVAADCAEGDPSKWREDQTLVEAFVERTGFKIKDVKKVVGTAIDKLASKLTAGMMVTDGLVEVPRGTLDRFLEMLDTMHREAMELSLTDLPARPVIDCRKCDFFEACTKDAERISSEEVTGDE